MPQVPVTPEEAAFLAERIARFEQEVSEQLRWQLPFVRQHQALPLYVAWTETAGFRADGTLVRWVTEDYGSELTGTLGQSDALSGGETLSGAAPTGPRSAQDARTCDGCEGNGTIRICLPISGEIICKCGGIGWLA